MMPSMMEGTCIHVCVYIYMIEGCIMFMDRRDAMMDRDDALYDDR